MDLYPTQQWSCFLGFNQSSKATWIRGCCLQVVQKLDGSLCATRSAGQNGQGRGALLSQEVLWLGQLSHLQAGKEESGGWWWCHHNDAQTAVSVVSWGGLHKVEEDVPWASNRQMACSGESGERRQRLPHVYSVQNFSKIRKTLKWCLNFLWCPVTRNVPRAPHCVK